MKKTVKMPKLNENMTKGVLAGWNKEPGDPVKKGDVLFEIETDKVVSEVESLEDGVLKEICVEEGDEVSVDSTVALLEV